VELREEQVFYDGRPSSLTGKSWRPRRMSAGWASPPRRTTPPRASTSTAPPEKGEPFAYHACGTALCEVTLDCLRGTYVVDAVQAVHDLGPSLDPAADRGQAEGGIVRASAG